MRRELEYPKDSVIHMQVNEGEQAYIPVEDGALVICDRLLSYKFKKVASRIMPTELDGKFTFMILEFRSLFEGTYYLTAIGDSVKFHYIIEVFSSPPHRFRH